MRSKKFLAIFLACLLIPSFAQASEKTSALSLPSDLARIEKVQTGTNGKTIVLIQEAHVDYGAQKAIAGILKSLIEKDSLRLVLVEGNWDDGSLSYLRTYASKEGRLEVSERYLKEGKISGEEYLDVVSDLDFQIWGIENPKFYEENMEAFLRIEPQQKEWLSKAGEFEALLDQLAEKIFPPQIQELKRKKSKFEEGTITLFDYLSALKKLNECHSRESGNPERLDPRVRGDDKPACNNGFASTPTLEKLISLLDGEVGIDPEGARQEKEALIRALSRKLTKPELAKIELLKNRKNSEEELEFIKSLLDLYQKYQNQLKSLSLEHLERYVRSLEETNRLDSNVIFGELEELEKKIADQNLSTPEQKRLEDVFRKFSVLKKLFKLQLTSEEFERLRVSDQNQLFISSPLVGEDKGGGSIPPSLPSPVRGEGDLLVNWQEFLKQRASEFSLKIPRIDMASLEKFMQETMAFYISARKREGALIENAIKKIEAEGSLKTALIAGGFHSENLTRAFNERGYSVAVVAPRFTPADLKDHDRHYFEILKYNWDSRENIAVSPAQKLS
ncbi:MAG: hypothetical protein HY583_03970 [Candidatus Omnitrophica bacterium]|nr:hypothetical protein [Candidatus Omnitrophota bacterium]